MTRFALIHKTNEPVTNSSFNDDYVIYLSGRTDMFEAIKEAKETTIYKFNPTSGEYSIRIYRGNLECNRLVSDDYVV